MSGTNQTKTESTNRYTKEQHEYILSIIEGEKSNTAEQVDKMMEEVLRKNIEDIKNNVAIWCLRTNVNLYKRYAEWIKQHPEYQKYLQIYNYQWKNFLVVPTFDSHDNQIEIETVQIQKEGENLKIISEPYWIPTHPYTKDCNVISLHIEDKTQKYWYHRLSMNKWTWEISDVEPSEYSMDEKWVEWLLNTISEKSDSKFEDCSEWMQSQVRDIISDNGEIKEKYKWLNGLKKELIEQVRVWSFMWAVNTFIKIVKSFFGKKNEGKIINLWNWINYQWDESDLKYLESAIETVLDPEKRSKLTYLLSKIKDKHTKDYLKEKWVENPSQFDLFLQHLKPGQVMLTNGLNPKEWKWTIFDQAIQATSDSRWCHSLIIEDVVEENWVIVDAKIIQSTFKEWVHETTLKKYVSEKFSSADFLVADLPENKRDNIIQHARARIWEKYDKVSIVTDTIFQTDVDKWFSAENPDSIKAKTLWNNKAYCSELIFDAMENSDLKMPYPRISPSDLLMSDEISPQYACYCDNF